MVNLQAGRLRGTVAISAPSQRTAEPQRKNEMEWEEALLYGLGAERYRRTPRPIIGGRQLEPGGSRKGPRPRPRRHGCSTTLIIMMSLLPRPIARERKQKSHNFLNAASVVS